MRHLLCADCAEDLKDGTREIYPGEFQRVQWGIVREPNAEQRTQYVNGEPIHLQPGHYDCDNCGAPIPPGTRACAESVWTSSNRNKTVRPPGKIRLT